MSRGGTFSIYLSGGMSGLQEGGNDFMKSSTAWRAYVEERFMWYEPDVYNKIYCYNPTIKYSYSKDNYLMEKEVVEYNYWQLKNSDLVIVFFNNPNSLGTIAEMTLAKYAWNIPVLGILPDEIQELDFTVRNTVDRLFSNIDDCLEYINEFYLT